MAISGHSKRVALCCGGALFVGLENVTLGDFDDDARLLFSRIADAMHDYESARRNDSGQSPPIGEAPTGGGSSVSVGESSERATSGN